MGKGNFLQMKSLFFWNDFELKFSDTYAYLIAITICIAFIPPFAFFLSIMLLFLYGLSGSDRRDLLLVFIYGATSSTLISGLSSFNFLTYSDDFITYYNNYLSFYNAEYIIGLTRFSLGFEPALPVVNLGLSLIILQFAPLSSLR